MHDILTTEAPHPAGAALRGERVLFTICSKNYLPQARILVRSVREQMPDAPVRVILSDEAEDLGRIAEYVGAEVIPGRALGLPTYYDMAMRYDIVEFNTALKPAAFLHFFAQEARTAVYLDPDIELFRPLTEVDAAFEAGAQGVITPHICEPLDMVHNPTELKIMRTGIYNLGFAGIANTEEGVSFTRWWARKMLSDCRVDLDAGIFVDQKYVDLMPSYLPRTKILRHRGYNVAYWNLANRALTREGDGSFAVNGQPLVFMHFSGVRPEKEDIISVHQDRVSVDDLGDGKALFDNYRAELKRAREEMAEAGIEKSYAYGSFTTGEAIPPLARQVYAKAIPPMRVSFDDVFDLEKGPFNQGATGINHRNQRLISPVMADLWMRKPYLQVAFNIRDPEEAKAYALWFAETGFREWNIPPAFIPKEAWELNRQRKTFRSRMAVFALQALERGKWFKFMYPKPVRRAAVRINRKVLPHLVKRIGS
ncbi:hypothetical protein [Parvularcula lutaonensis]|nr:hypothetical protein [Parvularcula lutaonensis]